MIIQDGKTDGHAMLKLENDQLKARVAEFLEFAKTVCEALGGECDAPGCSQCKAFRKAEEFIETTPKKSLAALQAESVAGLRFPTMLRKMWSGGEVQEWLLDEAARIRKGAGL